MSTQGPLGHGPWHARKSQRFLLDDQIPTVHTPRSTVHGTHGDARAMADAWMGSSSRCNCNHATPAAGAALLQVLEAQAMRFFAAIAGRRSFPAASMLSSSHRPPARARPAGSNATAASSLRRPLCRDVARCFCWLLALLCPRLPWSALLSAVILAAARDLLPALSAAALLLVVAPPASACASSIGRASSVPCSCAACPRYSCTWRSLDSMAVMGALLDPWTMDPRLSGRPPSATAACPCSSGQRSPCCYCTPVPALAHERMPWASPRS